MFFPVRTALFLFVPLFVPILVIAAVILLIRNYNKNKRQNIPTGTSQYIRDDAPEKRSLGEVLKAHRTRCNMTQEMVAESLGVSRQAVGKWESGNSEPSTANLIALARLYGVTVDELLRHT